MSFHLHGPLDPHSELFVGRASELAKIDLWLRRGDSVGAVLGGRQNGKTSLLFRARELARPWQAVAFVDFQVIAGADAITCARHIAEQINVQVFGKGSTTPSLPDAPGKLHRFLQEAGDAAPTARVGLFLDELGVLPDDTRRWLGSALRAAFNLRLVHDSLRRWTFVLCGGAELSDMAVHHSSPLRNVLDEIYLPDLSLLEVSDLLIASGEETLASKAADIYSWTGGQPYLTQALAQEALKTPLLEEAARMIIRSEAHNLPHVFSAILRGGLESLFKKIARGERVTFLRLDENVALLELIGVIVDEAGNCRVRNRIYSEAAAERYGRTNDRHESPAASGIRSLVFVSYCHEDDRWLNLLRKACAPFRDRMELWSDQDIAAGSNWRNEIDQKLSEARVAVLLVSAAFLDSHFISEIELPKMLKRHQDEGLIVLWAAVSAAAFAETDISGFQAMLDPKTPLDQMRLAKAKAAVVALSKQISMAMKTEVRGPTRNL